MRFKLLCSCVLFVFAVAATPAQTKMSTSGKCGKPDTAQSVTAGDKDGHVFMITAGKCVTAGKVAGATSKEGFLCRTRRGHWGSQQDLGRLRGNI